MVQLAIEPGDLDLVAVESDDLRRLSTLGAELRHVAHVQLCLHFEKEMIAVCLHF